MNFRVDTLSRASPPRSSPAPTREYFKNRRNFARPLPLKSHACAFFPPIAKSANRPLPVDIMDTWNLQGGRKTPYNSARRRVFSPLRPWRVRDDWATEFSHRFPPGEKGASVEIR